MHIGLYFGSFNPIHVGHLIIASYARHTTTLHQVWLVVSPQNPHKPAGSLLNEYDRLHLAKLATENDPNLRVVDIEFNLPKPSYTSATLAHLHDKYPQHTFSIIMGSDSYSNLPRWKNYQHLTNEYDIYVFLRPNHPIVHHSGKSPIVIDAPLLDISSTAIRQFIQQNIPIRYLVPNNVAEYIADNNYYKHGPAKL
ncbi:MAG: nicotinate-nucleotide adenylyltransferase [Bacteroidetes bacterium]|nr:MAG: nicotinate-nucleotide adenylyltransferase [Bacteroidota bacterium]